MAWASEGRYGQALYALLFAAGIASNLLCFARFDEQPEHSTLVFLSYVVFLVLQLRSLWLSTSDNPAVVQRALDIVALLAYLHLLFGYVGALGARWEIDWGDGLDFKATFQHNQDYLAEPLGWLLSQIDVLLAAAATAHLALSAARGPGAASR